MPVKNFSKFPNAAGPRLVNPSNQRFNQLVKAGLHGLCARLVIAGKRDRACGECLSIDVEVVADGQPE